MFNRASFVALDDVPGRLGDVGVDHHARPWRAVVLPPGDGLQVHRVGLSTPHHRSSGSRSRKRRCCSSSLTRGTSAQRDPVLDEHRSDRTLVETAPALGRAEPITRSTRRRGCTRDRSSTISPAAGRVADVPLEVPLPTLALARLGSAAIRATRRLRVLRDPLTCRPSGRVAAIETIARRVPLARTHFHRLDHLDTATRNSSASYSRPQARRFCGWDMGQPKRCGDSAPWTLCPTNGTGDQYVRDWQALRDAGLPSPTGPPGRTNARA